MNNTVTVSGKLVNVGQIPMFHLERALVAEELEWVEFVVVFLVFRSAQDDARLLVGYRRIGVRLLGICNKIYVGQHKVVSLLDTSLEL